ncbi:MAG: hypothetical protein IKK29_02470 [Christensenellaceae bacterium]|nr:hypothetical protein [Christensenellaceae bacterium]
MALMKINAKKIKDIAENCGILFLFSKRKDHYETRQANMLPDHYKGSTEAI